MTAIPPDILERIIADSVRRSGGDQARCRVLFARTVTWPDGSLGCPEPGISYTEARVKGYWVVLEVQSKQLDYRVTRLGHFRLCVDPDWSDPLLSDAV